MLRGSELPKLEERQTADAVVFDQVTLCPDELSMEPITDRIDRDDLPRPAKRRARPFLRIALVGLVLGVVGGTIFVLLGGVGALMVAGGAVAGLFLYAAPVVDPQLAAPPSQGTSGAQLVVMPDPGFTGEPEPLPLHLP